MVEVPQVPALEGQAYEPVASVGRSTEASQWRRTFADVFGESFESLHRFLNRLSGDADLASDLAQEAFVRLYRRGALPDDPEAWLFTVAMNLFRNAKSKRTNRARLLTTRRGLHLHSDPRHPPDAGCESDERRGRVRVALSGLKRRDRSLLLLAAEGHSYREMAMILELNEASVGTLLRRAKEAFRRAYEEGPHAP